MDARRQIGWPHPRAVSAGGIFRVGPVFLSANPTLNPEGTAGGGPARPVLFEFGAAEPGGEPKTHWPGWRNHPTPPPFTEHSYRSLAADGPGRELILFQNIGYTHAEWAFRDRDGDWSAQGQLKWPWGAEYDTPQPIRICYPNVALRQRAVHFVGVSDIVEPYAKWRQAKRELTGREWDYDFRRLFYAWSPDIARGGFRDWVEIASRDKTCGWVSPGDLWVAPDGDVHIVWTERALDERLRAKFFPAEKQRHELNYAVVREGRVRSRRTLLAADEGKPGLVVSLPRFQPLPDHRLCVFFHVQGTDETGQAVAENRLFELHSDGSSGPMLSVPLRHVLTSYFTATVRGGSAPESDPGFTGHAGRPAECHLLRARADRRRRSSVNLSMNLDLVGRPVPWPPSARSGLRALPAVPGSCPLSSSKWSRWLSMNRQVVLILILILILIGDSGLRLRLRLGAGNFGSWSQCALSR